MNISNKELKELKDYLENLLNGQHMSNFLPTDFVRLAISALTQLESFRAKGGFVTDPNAGKLESSLHPHKAKRSVGIFAKTSQDGEVFFDKIIGEMLYKDVAKVNKKKVNKRQLICHAELVNGMTYDTVSIDESSCGRRFTDVYIQKGIDQSFINCVIMPFLFHYDNLPEPTATYFE